MDTTLVHQQAAGLDMEGCGMNDDDTDSGGDFFIDMVKTILAIGFFLLFVSTIGAVLWGLIA
jgi:hypothetical protein